MKYNSLIIVIVSTLIIAILALLFGERKDETVDIKVMSYNIQHGVGLDGKLNLERIAKVIKESEVDIVGIQEVDKFYGSRSDFQNQPKVLAELLDFDYVYGPNVIADPKGDRKEERQYGTAILTKYPIIKSKNTFLTSDSEQRGVLHATIDVDGTSVNIFNTQLGLDPDERETQVNEIVEIMSEETGPQMVMGDFNARPIHDEIKLFLEKGKMKDTFQNI